MWLELCCERVLSGPKWGTLNADRANHFIYGLHQVVFPPQNSGNSDNLGADLFVD